MSKPKVAFFDFTCCEGCQIEFTNYGDAAFLELLNHVDVVEFREAMSEKTTEPIDIAFVEGSFTREADRARLESIRERAAIVIAYGQCAAGGRHQRAEEPPDRLQAVRVRRGRRAAAPRLAEGAADLGGHQGRLLGLRLPGEQVRSPADRRPPAARQGAGDPQLSGLRGVQAPRDRLPLRRGRPLHGHGGPRRVHGARVPPTASPARPAAASSITPTCPLWRRCWSSAPGSRRSGRPRRRSCSLPIDLEATLMTTTARIRVDHLTRVEGHGNIVVNVTDGVVEKCEWQVPEAPRFFESMVRGRHYSEVARITSRICGICSDRPHAGVGQGHGERARHRGQRAELEAPRADQARRELRLPRPARQLPGRPRPARRAVGVPAGRDARRGGGAGAAPQEAGARVGLAHRRAHHPPHERRPRRHGGGAHHQGAQGS